MTGQRLTGFAVLALAATSVLPLGVSAQTDSTKKSRDSTRARIIEPVNVTATRRLRLTFQTPSPVLVADSSDKRLYAAYTIPDLFRLSPGIDVTGTGSNQARFIIRGQRGQRILLLENGIRLNNPRRQQDFGELPALSDIEGVERAEVVRGPSSVLYGTDAIGGVVNIVTAGAPTIGPNRVSGSLAYRYSSHDRQQRPSGVVSGRLGPVGIRVSGTFRETDPYEAPSGSFGDVHIDRPVRVHDTGVRDANYTAEVAVPFGGRHEVSARFGRYHAKDAAFGYVSGGDLGDPDAAAIRIYYPHQTFNQASLRYAANEVKSLFADRIDVTAYHHGNERDFNIDVFVPFGPPGAGVESASRNFTDIDTRGARIELAKVLAGRHVFTYGIDFINDDSFNRDSSASTVRGFGPPQTTTSTVPSVPNARSRSVGGFAQAAMEVASRVTAVLGVRYQDVLAETKETQGLSDPLMSSSDQTVVGAANLLFKVSPNLALVASAGRGFRSPNLVERFYHGPTSEGGAYQIRNPALEPETSFNLDFGAKLRAGSAYLEVFYFRNTIRNGIRAKPTGEQVGPFPEFQNVNIDKLRDEGVEILGDVHTASGFGVRASFSSHSSTDVLDPDNPVGDTFSSKVAGELRFDDPAGRFWLNYWVRHNGERKDVDLGTSPVGPVLPAFTVQGAGAGVTFLRSHRMSHSVAVNATNLTNALYAEFSNVSFFRPEPKRAVAVTYRLAF